LGHVGFEADDFVLEPFGFLRGVAMVVFIYALNECVASMQMRWGDEPEPDAPDERMQQFGYRQQH
jgi:hypothetical protein